MIIDTAVQKIYISYIKFSSVITKVGVWCPLHVRTILGNVFYADVIKYEKYVRKILHIYQ
jgi:hypothetical protein